MIFPQIYGGNRLTRILWETKFYWTPRRWGIPLSQIKIDRPIFLLGTQSGGLTILARILNRHSSAVYCSGNNQFWAGRDEMQNVRYLNLPEAFRLGRLGDRYLMFGKNRLANHPEFGNARSFIYACDDLIGDYRKTEKEYTSDIRAGLENTIKRCIRAYAHDVHRCRFIDKSQSYTLKVPLLRRCLSKPKFILVARNPFALCARYVQEGQVQKERRQWRKPPDAQRRLDISLQHWKNTFSIALQDLKGREDALILRLEDFLLSPEKKLREILDFLEMPWEEGLLPAAHDHVPLGSVGAEKWYPLKMEVNEKYLKRIDPVMKRYMQERLGQAAEEFGYV